MCDLDLEWVLLIIECIASHIFGFLFLPMFTLTYSKNRKLTKIKSVSMKNLKKQFKDDGQKKKDDDLVGVESEDLYDGDADDQVSQEKGIQSDVGSMQQAVYLLGFYHSLLFFLSSLFTYITRRELIF